MFDDVFRALPEKPPVLSNQLYRERQVRLLSQLDADDLVIISSLPEATRSNDVHYPYRSSSDMMYMCGWTDPDATLMFYNKEGKWITSLCSMKDTLMEIWEGRNLVWKVHSVIGQLTEPIPLMTCALISNIFLNQRFVYTSRPGIDPRIDSIVMSAVEKRDQKRQHFGSGPISVRRPQSSNSRDAFA